MPAVDSAPLSSLHSQISSASLVRGRFSMIKPYNMSNSSTEALAALQQLEENGNLKDRLAIIRISEPISTEVGGSYPSPSKRTSDVSVSNFDDPTPASLEADLAHYKVRDEPECPLSRPANTDVRIGTILQTAILLSRASNERKILARHCWRPAYGCRTQ